MTVYSKPEEFELTPICDIELDDESYSFNILAVWKHKDGRVLYAQDSGCSCPSPFEDYHKLEDLHDAKLDITSIEETIMSARGLNEVQKKEYIKLIKDSLPQ